MHWQLTVAFMYKYLELLYLLISTPVVCTAPALSPTELKTPLRGGKVCEAATTRYLNISKDVKLAYRWKKSLWMTFWECAVYEKSLYQKVEVTKYEANCGYLQVAIVGDADTPRQEKG